uniref:Uncharacterized protein n=1 Tax=Knipowitschia caucasica TaxID=637954 RepID=A0AAV2LPZ6_KNICA
MCSSSCLHRRGTCVEAGSVKEHIGGDLSLGAWVRRYYTLLLITLRQLPEAFTLMLPLHILVSPVGGGIGTRFPAVAFGIDRPNASAVLGDPVEFRGVGACGGVMGAC